MSKTQDKKTKFFLNLNFLLCLILAGTLIFYWLKIAPIKNEPALAIISIVATLTVVFGAIRSLKNKKISIDLLASIALLASLLEREWASAIFINLMVASARTFTNFVEVKSHSALASLLKLKPSKAKILDEGKITEVPLEKIQKGDRVVIELGDKVPVDGYIEKGEAMINQSSLTGESTPIFKKKGDKVLSFTTLVSGNLIIYAEKVGAETTFEKIIALVEKSQANKAAIYTLVDKFAKWYIVITILGAIFIYLFSRDISLVLALLLVSCADDIAVATPMALTSAITHSAKHGAIIKGGNFLEGLAKLKILIVDKTGTLTLGKLKIENVFAFNKKKNDEVLRLAAVASSCSTHPVAQTIFNYAKEKNISIENPEKFEEHGGRGMVAIYKNKNILTGKLSFFKEMKIEMNEEQIAMINKETAKGLNVTLVGCEGELIGFIILDDELKPKAKETMSEFKKLGVERIIMLTGDNEKIAQKVSNAIGIDEFHANLLPTEKLEYLKRYLNKKYKVAMIGDGVNDAPALALSDIGIAMGAIGSDAAIEVADIAMMQDDLSQIPELMKIGRAAIAVIRQNLLLWGALNVFGFTLVFAHILNPSGAAAYNFVTDFIPILNSLRLFK